MTAAPPPSPSTEPPAPGHLSAMVLAATALVVPAVGSPTAELLQDTLKSALVALGVLVSAWLLLWQLRRRPARLHWHPVLLLPALLAAYALAAIAWSPAYFAGTEALRWSVFTLLVWLGLNVLTRERLGLLAWGIHAGAAIASLWAVLQFWFNLQLFSQGMAPGSTFVNRNFFAEYAVMALPFSVLLLLHARGFRRIALLAATSALIVLAVMMTGTRSATVTMLALLAVVLPAVAWACRRQLAWASWNAGRWLLVAAIWAAMLLGLGSIRSTNPDVIEYADTRGMTALERCFKRAGSIAADDHSLGVRLVMWRSTARMFADNPLAGVGPGSWEREQPRYQAAGSQVETDFYAHNEYVQVLAEYGLAGVLFLAGLFAFVGRAAYLTFRRGAAGEPGGPWRAAAVCSVGALLLVAIAGFPWHLAGSAFLFALGLAILAAPPAGGGAGRLDARALGVQPRWAPLGMVLIAASLAAGAYFFQHAAASEKRLVKALALARSISASGMPRDARMAPYKEEALRLVREGTAMNPHYRRITAEVGDHFASWGDWANATWIWETVVSSRPYVVVILTNIARGHLRAGHPEKAAPYLDRARAVQPDAPTVRSVEVLLAARTDPARALELGRAALQAGVVDYDLFTTTADLSRQAGDHRTALRALQARQRAWPAEQPGPTWVQIGNLHHALGDPAQALAAFRRGLQASPGPQREALMGQIPAGYGPQLR